MNYLIEVKDLHFQARKIFDGLDVSESTRKDYSARIGMFIDFIHKEGFRVNSYLEYKRHLEKRTDYTISTKNKYLATAKIFLKETNRLGLIPVDITQNIRLFRQNKPFTSSLMIQVLPGNRSYRKRRKSRQQEWCSCSVQLNVQSYGEANRPPFYVCI